jgi:hypothetical protein
MKRIEGKDENVPLRGQISFFLLNEILLPGPSKMGLISHSRFPSEEALYLGVLFPVMRLEFRSIVQGKHIVPLKKPSFPSFLTISLFFLNIILCPLFHFPVVMKKII